MRVGSLFSGIGGFELGFERAGFEVAWQVEIDPWCRRVLAKHWPSVPRYEDVRHVGSHNLEWVDVLIGGFPCQDISNAGTRSGLAGERSGLWYEFARIIRELRPRYIAVENVAALLHRGVDVVLGELAACGYDAEWQVLPAAAFGAPHRRDRLFIVAYPASAITPTEDIPELFRSRRLGTRSRKDTPGANWWAVEPPVGRVANGVPRRVDRLRGLGNAVVPAVAQYVAECVRAHAQATGQWVEAA